MATLGSNPVEPKSSLRTLRPRPSARPIAPRKRTSLALLAAAYGATEFVWKSPEGQTFVGGRSRRTGGGTRPNGLPARYHVLTAWNPDSIRLPSRLNRQRNRALRADLVSAGRRPLPILGRAPPSSGVDWSEESFAVEGLSRADAVRWGRTHGQVAVFEVEGRLRRVVFCAAARASRWHRLVWTRASAR